MRGLVENCRQSLLNMEKRNYNKKVISKLKIDDGIEIKDPKKNSSRRTTLL